MTAPTNRSTDTSTQLSAGTSRPTALLLVDQIRYQLLMMWRIPVALFFTLALPLIMFVLFNTVFDDDSLVGSANDMTLAQFYTGGLAAFTAVSATYTNLANMVPLRRDEGILKRWRGTPLPTWTYLGGFVGQAVILAAIGMVLMIGAGIVFYDVTLEAAKVPYLLAAFVVGVASFGALGVALSCVVPNASSSAAAANATLLPLAFVSDVFLASEDTHRWLDAVGNFFPLKPFAEALQDVFDLNLAAGDVSWSRLGYIALWGLVGLAISVRFFRWDPAPGGPGRRRQRDNG